MGTKETHSTDKDSGKITQINYTEKRPDGKIETRHVNPDSGKYTGKSVHNSETGRTEYYSRESAGLGSGSCCLTAICFAMGMQADCLELNKLRNFRDNILAQQPAGAAIIKEYYRSSPEIVRAIEKSQNPKELYLFLYTNLIKKSVDLIGEKRYSEVLNNVTHVLSELKERETMFCTTGDLQELLML